jgi:hypothetical protein
MSSILVAQTAFGLIDAVPSGPDLADLHERLAESTFVVTGRLLSRQPVMDTVRPASWQVGPNLWATEPLTFPRGGTLFTVAVGQVFCQKEDFDAAAPVQADAPRLLHVFVPFDGPQSAQSRFEPQRLNAREYLMQDRDYLLFLYVMPRQDTLVKQYELDSKLTYYRTVEGQRGAVALPDEAHPEKPRDFITPLVQAVTTFCEAMKGPDAATKIRQLQAVRGSFDYPAWRQSVDRAIQGLQGPPRRLP